MRTSTIFSVLLIVAALAASLDAGEANTLSEKEKASGFQSLFNGKDLTDWEVPGENWKAVDGAIERTSGGGGLTYKAAKIPDDFELRFEWKVGEGSNSGVYYRPGQYEYQILDNKRHRDGEDPRTSAASLYYCMAPKKDVTKPVGEWNQGRIRCYGTIIEHWLNGEKVVNFDYTDEKHAELVERLRKRGANVEDRGRELHLQDHGDPVWYRSIRLREIKDPKTPDA